MTDNGSRERQSLLQGDGPFCQITYVSNGIAPPRGIPAEQRPLVEEAARLFLQGSRGDACVLVAGQLQSDFNDVEHSTENAVAERCRSVLGNPADDRYDRNRTVDLVLDTLGGSLDSAFRIVLFMSRFTSRLRVFVPRRAKSAGTLIAAGAREVYLTPFAELGPLDTQIPDPRNPTERVSALDCYQSVDYVRTFGIDTLQRALIALGKDMKTGIPVSELINTATAVADSCTKPMLANVAALDFGGWGRTLQIGERYTQSVLARAGYDDVQTSSIADRLVYGYTHHPFPIDIQEAQDIGLHAKLMKPAVADPALTMVRECADLDVAIGVWQAQERQGDPADGDEQIEAENQEQPTDPAHGHSRDRHPATSTAADRNLVVNQVTPTAVVNLMREILVLLREQEHSKAG
jgi:Serine dehydrogenase proteinase